MITISLKLPETLAARLQSTARRKRVSKSALLREALEAYLANGGDQTMGASLYDLAKDLIGSLDSGVGDLSYNPKHMEGFGR